MLHGLVPCGPSPSRSGGGWGRQCSCKQVQPLKEMWVGHREKGGTLQGRERGRGQLDNCRVHCGHPPLRIVTPGPSDLPKAEGSQLRPIDRRGGSSAHRHVSSPDPLAGQDHWILAMGKAPHCWRPQFPAILSALPNPLGYHRPRGSQPACRRGWSVLQVDVSGRKWKERDPSGFQRPGGEGSEAWWSIGPKGQWAKEMMDQDSGSQIN